MNNVYGDVSRMLQNDSNQYQSASYEPSPYSQPVAQHSPSQNSELSEEYKPVPQSNDNSQIS